MEKKEINEQLEYAKESMGFTPEIMQLIGAEAPEWFNLNIDHFGNYVFVF